MRYRLMVFTAVTAAISDVFLHLVTIICGEAVYTRSDERRLQATVCMYKPALHAANDAHSDGATSIQVLAYERCAAYYSMYGGLCLND